MDENKSAESVDSAMAKTTTISTIAVQSGKTRIVIALLHCGNWLQLKILEIVPELTKLGANLQEALDLQKAHNEVLRQLQNKQSPVEELLRQADQLIATQKPRAEVYAAMAETLGRAWRDINFNLELRKQILDLNVQYWTQAEEFFEKISTLEASCTDTVVPIEIQAVKDFLSNIHDLRRTLLESLMGALQAGNLLLGKLKELETEGTLDSRPEHIRKSVKRALSEVQSWLDDLHLRRQHVEVIFNRRKLQLEQCLALAMLAADLRELEDTVVNARNRLANMDQLGDSPASSELLQHENKKLLPEAKILQEKALKITKATEQLLASGCFAGEEATRQSYDILSLTSDYLTEVQNRNLLLERVVEFFRSAQTALNKLDQLEIQLTTSDLKSTSPQLIQLHSQCAQTIEEITSGPIAQGYSILDEVGRGAGTEGVRKTVENLENIKIRLDSLCVAHREENLKINRALESFFEEYSSIMNWLTNIAEAFLQGHQDMGSDLPMAEDFMNLHRKLLTDLQDKGNEINTLLLTLPPIIELLDDDRREDVDAKVEELHKKWMKLKGVLENRLDLGKIYIKFHTESNIVNREIDKLENELQSKGADIDDETLKNIENRWESLEPLYQSAKNTGLTFINDAKKVSEAYLDTNRACLCVETVLQKLAGRQLQVTRCWQTFYTNVVEQKELLIKIEETMAESTKTINWVTKLEAQLYPIITLNSFSSKETVLFIENKLETILPDIKRAQNEVEQKIKTAESLLSMSQNKNEKSQNVKNKLCELNQKLIEITNDYHNLLKMLISYFTNLNGLENTIEKVNTIRESPSYPTKPEEMRSSISEHETSNQAILEMFDLTRNECEQIVNRMRRQEPTEAAEYDIEKLRRNLEIIRSVWEEKRNIKREFLDKQFIFCQFCEDLDNINKSINSLENQNQELKNRHGKSLEEARASSLAYKNFERTIEDLDKKIANFVAYGEKIMMEQHTFSPSIRQHINELEIRWSNLKDHIQNTRHLIDLSVKYFQLAQEAEEWFKEGSRLLVSIARRSTLVKKPQEAEELLNEISTFLKPGEKKQNERIDQIAELAREIYGPEQSSHLSQVVDDNREMLKSFSIVQEELHILTKNLINAEAEKLRLKKEQEEAEAKLAAARAEALAAEKARIAAELERKAAEEAAKKAELEALERQRQAEQARIAAELERRAAEEAARQAEQEALERQRQAEQARIAAELERKTAEEAARKAELEALERQRQAEQARIAAELERKAAEEAARQAEAEALERKREAEQAKLAAEFERKAFEEAAKQAELEALERQKQAEQAKLAAELERKAAEEVARRAEQEALERQKQAEKAKLEAELEKKAIEEATRRAELEALERQRLAEEARIAAELERKAAEEAARKARFEAFKQSTVSEAVLLRQQDEKSQVRIIDVKLETSPQKADILECPLFINPLSDAVIQEGSKFSFTCQVTGYPIPVVTWYKAGIPIQNNPDYQTTFDQGKCTLFIEETFSDDSGKYTCKAINAAGSAETSANLSVNETEPEEQLSPPSFSKLLEPAFVKEGSNFQFQCKVEGNPLPNVQWYKNQDCIDYSHGYNITYNNGEAILKFENIEMKDKAEYTCKATNQLGSAQSTASLSISPITPTKPPCIVLPLSNVMARAGQKIKLECEISGLPFPDVTWYQNEHPLSETHELKLHREGDSATLIIHEAFLKDAGTYKVTARNIAGEASSSCSVSVKGRLPTETSDSEIASDMEPVKPSIQLPLADVVINEGSRVRLDCVIIGQPEPEVIWYHDERPVKESSDCQLLFQGDRCSLVIQEALTEDEGEYKVVALNSAGEASSKCILKVKLQEKSDEERTIPIGYPPKFNKLLTDVLVSEGERVLFEGNVSGQPTPEIKWLLNNLEVILDDHIEIIHDNDGNIKLEIHKVKPEDKGVYTVKASNEHGEAKCFAQLIVKSSKPPETVKYEEIKTPPIFTQIFNDKTAFENTSTKFECIVTGKPKPKIKWLFNGEPLSENQKLLVSTLGDRQILSIPNITKDVEGKITCIAENEAGTARCTANLTVHPLSTITLPDQNIHNIDSSAMFIKREVHTESSTVMSSKVVTSNSEIPEPQTKIHSFSSHDEKTFKQINQQTPEISEKHNVEEYLDLGGKEPVIHEKSSSIFTTEKPQIPIQHGISQKSIVKTRAPKFMTPVIGKIVDQNTDVILEGIIDGQPSPNVTWTKNGKEISPSDKISIKWEFNKASIEIRDTSSSDAGRYTCTANNEAGTAISTADLVVRKSIFPPVFGRRLQAQVIKKGDRIIMEVEVTGTPEPTITWFKDNVQIEQALTDNYKIKSFGNSHTLIIEKADLKHSGRFMVRAVNSGGEAQSLADIAVFEPTPDTMVEVVKTVVFEDVRKHETLTSAADKVSSKPEQVSKIVEIPKPVSLIQPKDQIFESSLSSSTKSEYSTFSEQQMSQHVTKARLEYTAPEIQPPKPIQKQMDFEIVEPPFEPDIKQYEEKEEIKEGIETSSITKKSSLEFFVKKIEETKDNDKEMSPPKKLESYKKFEPKPSLMKEEILESTPDKIITEEFSLKPEPPAKIFTSEPVTKIEHKHEEKKIQIEQLPAPDKSSRDIISLPPMQPPAPLFISDQSQFYEQKSFQSHEEKVQSYSKFEKISRAVSPRPEALEMEKLWAPKKDIEHPIIFSEIKTQSACVTETPRIHYVANVSHCIQPCERTLDEISTKSEHYEFQQYGMKQEKSTIESHNIKPSEAAKIWPAIPRIEQPPSFKPFISIESLPSRPISVQDITNEVILEPGPPPIIDYAQPPRIRKQSYVETVEQELETKLESVPAKVPPGGVRTIPPPLPPKKEQPTAPPIPAKPISRKTTTEKFPDLEPFPFKPDPEKQRPMKTGPPPTPSKFIKGKFTDSDYESDFESGRIPAKWKPCVSDNEEPSYRKVRVPKVGEKIRSRSTEPEPLPPSQFDSPPQFLHPPRPEVKFDYQKQTSQTMRHFKKQQETERIIPLTIKPGSPPIYVEAPSKKIDSPKTKRKVFIDGYMADTDEPFFQQKLNKSETHEIGTSLNSYEYKSESLTESSQKSVSTTFQDNLKPMGIQGSSIAKELTATPIITSVSTEKHNEKYEKQTKMEQKSYTQTKSSVKCPPPPSPSKFVKGEFRESDYESDYEKSIPKVWTPSGSSNVPNYRPIKPVLTPTTGRHSQIGRTPTPPTDFEEPAKTGQFLRPKFEPIEKLNVEKQQNRTIVVKPKALNANQKSEVTRYIPIRPGTPPEMAYTPGPQTTQIYRSTTSMPYHNAIQTETSNIVHFKESNEKCHRTMSVEQSTKVIKFGDKQTKITGPPISCPKKFQPGEHRESDYESEIDNVKFKPRWAPYGSDAEEIHFRSVQPPSPRASSVPPPSRERVITPMEFDKYPSYKSSDLTDGEIRKIESNKHLFSTRSRSHEPPLKRMDIQPGPPPEYGYISDPKFKAKATNIASQHMDSMTQSFKNKTQKFVKDIMSDVQQKSVPKKSILKNGEDKDAQVYREETRSAQHGTKHIDPDTGLIYFKYDFGYEFGIILPGESKDGGIPVPPKTILTPPKRTGDIEMPVYHETTKKTHSNSIIKPKTKFSNKNIKWDPTSESELSEYEGNAAKKSLQGSRWEPSSCSPVSLSPSLPSTSPAFNNSFAGRTETPPSCPSTPVNAQKGSPGQIKAPMFITPLRNIAVVSGQNAKFECIVQSEPAPNVLWSKNGRIIEDSNDCQLHYRNGVCRLTISRAYPEDAGTYTCTASNSAGSASTTAILDVPGEIRSLYIK